MRHEPTLARLVAATRSLEPTRFWLCSFAVRFGCPIRKLVQVSTYLKLSAVGPVLRPPFLAFGTAPASLPPFSAFGHASCPRLDWVVGSATELGFSRGWDWALCFETCSRS